MVYRKGELSKAAIDRGWPFQVALEARFCMGDNFIKHRLYCRELSLCARGHSFYRENRDYHVFCFAIREHAESFAKRFRGEFMDAKDRPTWPHG